MRTGAELPGLVIASRESSTPSTAGSSSLATTRLSTELSTLSGRPGFSDALKASERETVALFERAINVVLALAAIALD